MQRDDLEQRLQAVLRDFETLADSDPIKLRALIPPSEIWRLFVEADRQNDNYKLAHYLKLSNLQRGLGKTARNFSLARVSHLSSISKPTWPTLIRRLHLSQSDLEFITLGDLIDFNKGWFLFELGERNYIKGLYKAFQCIFEHHDKLELSYIIKVNQITTEGVTNTNFRLYDDVKHGGKIRKGPEIRFGIDSTNTSEDGIFEILEREDSYSNFSILNWIINWRTPTELRSGFIPPEAHSVKNQYPDFYQAIFSAKSNRELANAIFEFILSECNTLFFQSIEHSSDVVGSLKRMSMKVLEQYNQKKTESTTHLEDIYAIADCINQIEDIHLFDDANGRTTGMITFNNLLFNSKLPLSFIRDANYFDGKSKAELVEAIIEGMEDVMTLVKTGLLHGIKTSDLLAMADKPNTIGATRKYFDEAVAFEVRARRRITPQIASQKRTREDEDKTNKFESKRKYQRYE